MTYVEINGKTYPALISGKNMDPEWDNRASKSITLEMTYEEAMDIFMDGLEWNVIYQEDNYVTETGSVITPDPIVYDNSDFSVAGPITNNRDGSVVVKMGKITDAEALAELMEVLNEQKTT